MSSLRRIGPIVALAAAVLLATGCGGGNEESPPTTAPEPAQSSSGASAAALDPEKTYTVTLKTNQGTFAFDLDPTDSPHTTASFADLVEKGFFDGLTSIGSFPGS